MLFGAARLRGTDGERVASALGESVRDECIATSELPRRGQHTPGGIRESDHRVRARSERRCGDVENNRLPCLYIELIAVALARLRNHAPHGNGQLRECLACALRGEIAHRQIAYAQRHAVELLAVVRRDDDVVAITRQIERRADSEVNFVRIDGCDFDRDALICAFHEQGFRQIVSKKLHRDFPSALHFSRRC